MFLGMEGVEIGLGDVRLVVLSFRKSHLRMIQSEKLVELGLWLMKIRLNRNRYRPRFPVWKWTVLLIPLLDLLEYCPARARVILRKQGLGSVRA